ncbi:hypothetical protein BD410DRAFT_825560 [Rickenella mellea]|uniref:Uncharacterized protein n=1 Tax=Rickenella mellea TaxID=50990 RepID=A0A4Y7QJ91_9AGAM|nr:hypothetical protein BD410DRAFT_825560 [Rickenella mellea]
MSLHSMYLCVQCGAFSSAKAPRPPENEGESCGAFVFSRCCRRPLTAHSPALPSVAVLLAWRVVIEARRRRVLARIAAGAVGWRLRVQRGGCGACAGCWRGHAPCTVGGGGVGGGGGLRASGGGGGDDEMGGEGPVMPSGAPAEPNNPLTAPKSPAPKSPAHSSWESDIYAKLITLLERKPIQDIGAQPTLSIYWYYISNRDRSMVAVASPLRHPSQRTSSGK